MRPVTKKITHRQVRGGLSSPCERKVLLLPCCESAVSLHRWQHAATLPEAGGDVCARDQDMRASVGVWWGEPPSTRQPPARPVQQQGLQPGTG